MTPRLSQEDELVPTPIMRAVLSRLAAEDAGLGDPTLMRPADGRALAETTNRRWNEQLPAMDNVTDFVLQATEGHEIACRLLRPEEASGLIVFVHGGGWALCSMATHERAARLLALEAKASILTFDYRLAPENPFPDGLNDCKAVWKAVMEGHPALFDATGPLGIAGDSAGANLALSLILDLQNESKPFPDTALLFYGVYDANFNTASYIALADGPGLTRAKMMRYWDWYTSDPADRNKALVSPQRASDAQLRKLPPLYLNAAAIDPLRSDTENLVRRLRSLGRTDRYSLYPGVVHGFMQMSRDLPEARMAAAEAGSAFRELARP